MITPNQVGLPLCKWCRRPINTDLQRHQNRCFWCSTCDDFLAADVGKHICIAPHPNTFPCPICAALTKTNNYLRHLRVVHPDVDAELYRRRTESTRDRDRRLQREGKVCISLFVHWGLVISTTLNILGIVLRTNGLFKDLKMRFTRFT